MRFPGPDDLDSFPLIADFAVTLRDSHEGGRHVELTSAGRGRLAGFPAWDHADRDLRHFTPADVPLGTIDQPFDDAGEQWRILIFEHGRHVYVLEGSSPRAEEFGVFFRIPRDRYLAAWAALIDAYNPITPLAGTDP
ncbi:MAG TPA: hypothetical protein VNA04_17095 [Thermoanaerobaculia bacterium]|nr:hypothetical protein [Thermoanaerobaculia bacterium]